jgi:hypothetical protein
MILLRIPGNSDTMFEAIETDAGRMPAPRIPAMRLKTGGGGRMRRREPGNR